MKNIKFMIAALCVVMFAACQDKGEWDAPSDSAAPQYGNNNITETNVLSIKDLMAKYAAEIKNDRIIEITEDIQIKGRVAANDVGGNFYKKITIQDEPANAADMRAMTISIDESGLWGYLPIGQQIVVSLKGLCIGGYGEQAQLGTPYTNAKGVVSVGRMSKHVWQQHFKIVGDVKELAPVEFTSSFMNEKDNFSVGGKNYSLVKNAGKLVVFKNVTFKNADGKATLKSGTEAPLSGYFIQEVDQFPGVQFFTSGDYAKFSSTVLPYDEATGKAIPCTIIGVAGYYNGTWQISIRRTSDITVGETKESGDEGGEDAGNEGTDETLAKEVNENVVTFTNSGVTASANVITVDFNEQGWADTQDVNGTTVTLSDGTTITIGQGDGKTSPKFYSATKGLRIYAKNTITINSSSKPIAKAVLTCDTYKVNNAFCVGNDAMYAKTEGNTLSIVNDWETNSGGTQLRVQTIEITYAE